MTNSRLTDPEILEFRFPVVLEDFHIRRGSGGKGRWHAGDGTRAPCASCEPMDCAILSGHRRVRRSGLRAASRANSARTSCAARTAEEALAGCDQTVLEAGEAITIVTPTGRRLRPAHGIARPEPS